MKEKDLSYIILYRNEHCSGSWVIYCKIAGVDDTADKIKLVIIPELCEELKWKNKTLLRNWMKELTRVKC